MSWFKLDDQFPTHPKVLRAGPDASWLYICGGCYCAKHLTDGIIPKVAVPTLTTLRAHARLAAVLVREGLWHDRGDEFEVHDYLAYNPTREQIESTRHNKSMAGAKGAASRWHGSTHSSSDAPVPIDTRDCFDVWWKACPKKLDKAAAEKVYVRHLRNGVHVDDLFAAIEHYAEWAATQDQQFVKYPKTFLNQSWSDWVDGIPDDARLSMPASLDELATPSPRLAVVYECTVGNPECRDGFIDVDGRAFECECRRNRAHA